MNLSSPARRVFMALCQMAEETGSDTVAASYEQIRQIAGCNRTSVSHGLDALISEGWITSHREFKTRAIPYAYTIHPKLMAHVPQGTQAPLVSAESTDSPISTESTVSTVRPNSESHSGTNGTFAHRYISAADSESAAAARTPQKIESAPETEPEQLRRMKALLSEFAIGEPVRSQLAAILVQKAAPEPQIRRICEYTRAEWEAGKVRNPAGLTIVRLRDHANGVQLSMLQEVPNKPVAAQPRRRFGSSQKPSGRSKTFMRPQVEYSTDAEREEARERAKERIAARGAPVQDARRAAQAAQMRAALADPRTTADQRRYYETCLAQLEGRQGDLS